MGRTRSSFTKEFKLEAVRLITEGEQSIAQVMRDLGIRATILGRWKKDWEQDREAAFPGKGHCKPAEVELRHLRRENERLRMERDIFKKTAIFSRDSLDRKPERRSLTISKSFTTGSDAIPLLAI